MRVVVANVDSPLEQGRRLSASIETRAAELPRLRAALSDWLSSVGVGESPAKDVVLAAHEIAAEAIERGAVEVAVLGEVIGDTIRVSVAGGDWSSLDELRSALIRGLIGEIRVHRGIVTMRLRVSGVSSVPGEEARADPPKDRASSYGTSDRADRSR